MDALHRKKISRSALRTHCKKIEAKITDLVDGFAVEKTVELKALKLNYQAQIDKIKAVDEDIMGLMPDETDLMTEMGNSLEENDRFYNFFIAD